MIEKIIEFCAKNRFLVLLLILFLVLWAYRSLKNIPLDAIPDLSETQVIILVRWDRPPQIIEAQVTYPIITALLGAPRVKDIRGITDYGFSFIYVIFEEGVDIYWARSRIIEYLSNIIPKLPEGIQVELGPDATGLGWVFMYALKDRSGKHSLEELQAFQKWHLKYILQSVKGVAEVSSIGGFTKQYQVILNPQLLLSYGVSAAEVVNAIQKSNQEQGARIIEMQGREYMVTAKGYISSIEDIKEIVVKVNSDGIPIKIKDLANVRIGPDIRRGIADLDGEGEVVGGIVIMRTGENALEVIKRVKEKLKEVRLPDGVELVITYDRSDLILKAIDTLKRKLTEEMIIVSAVILLFLLHIPSAVVPIVILPTAVLLSFIPMYYLRITSNIMSLGGIALSIGAMVDSALAIIENSHKRVAPLWRDGRNTLKDYESILTRAIKEVGRPAFFTLLVITVSFLPIFALESTEGKLFKPLAFTKTFSMLFASLLSITLVPAVITTLVRPYPLPGFRKIWDEEEHPISKFLHRVYTKIVRVVLKYPKAVVTSAGLIFLGTLPLLLKLGSEFMPPLNEGSILYMPTTPPGISATEAGRLLQIQDKILKSFPEVLTVFGKAGRAETSTDPAPLSMMETVVTLKPPHEWREKDVWYRFLPEPLKKPLRLIWPDRISWEELIEQMDKALQIPGQVNAWTMPIKTRIDMLTTGIRTPIGIKIYGYDLDEIDKIGRKIESILKDISRTRSVFAEKIGQGYFIDIIPKREEIARYGLTIEDIHREILASIGGENIAFTIEGMERFPINVRYPYDYRNSPEKLKNVYIRTSHGFFVPLSQLVDISISTGPSMIRNENGRLVNYVYVDIEGKDIGGYVREAKRLINERLELPPGYTLVFSGQYEYMERVKEKLKFVVPLTLFSVFLLLYINTRSFIKTSIVMLAVPFSLVGAALTLYILDYNVSIAVWVGIIALLGVDAETGVFMLLYLDLAYEEMKKKGKLITEEDLKLAVIEGSVKRLRPKLMTVGTTFLGLLPIMWAQTHELGADTMKRIVAPMIGGIFSSFVMELIVYPAIYFLWKKRKLSA